ncbi:MAG: hypothetical protein PHS57_00110 [Alphaproteobacteria bacterium]|nr:hypothetical protein [Alphaproteobacteria bacterium]
MFRFLTILCLAFLLTHGAAAGQAEVREVALLNNCSPKKIEVYQNILGNDGRTVYKVSCNLPKTVETETKAPDAIIIGCQQSLCTFLRTFSDAAK